MAECEMNIKDVKPGDRVVLVDADGDWSCVVVKVEGDIIDARTDDGRRIALHHSWFRKHAKRRKSGGDS